MELSGAPAVLPSEVDHRFFQLLVGSQRTQMWPPRLLRQTCNAARFLISMQPEIPSRSAHPKLLAQLPHRNFFGTGSKHKFDSLIHHSLALPRHIDPSSKRRIIHRSTVKDVLITKCKGSTDSIQTSPAPTGTGLLIQNPKSKIQNRQDEYTGELRKWAQ